MRLGNQGAGEIADRLTILALKRLHGTHADKDTAHFDREWGILLVQFRRYDATKLMEPLLELAAVNAALWTAEDELRAYRTGPSGYLHHEQDVAALAFWIQEVNDKRAVLVGTLNRLVGEDQGSEKLT